ncbi:865_t:CDS:1, partial [Entrophospora sp. SA101]
NVVAHNFKKTFFCFTLIIIGHTAHEHIMLQFEGDDKPIKFDLVEVETLLDLSKSQTLKKILNQLGSSATDSLKFFASNNRDRHLPYHTLIVNLDE